MLHNKIIIAQNYRFQGNMSTKLKNILVNHSDQYEVKHEINAKHSSLSLTNW
jgi:hypothetical protein